MLAAGLLAGCPDATDRDPPQDTESTTSPFGFTTGDEVIAEPYFYATAYPLPKKLPSAKMPEGAAWQSEPWQGAVLKYEKLLTHPQPEKLLLGFLRGVQKAAARLMR